MFLFGFNSFEEYIMLFVIGCIEEVNMIENIGKLFCFYLREKSDEILYIEEKKEKEIKE